LSPLNIHENTVLMNTHSPNKNTQKHFDLREDLAHSRDLAPREIEAFGYVLGWLEDWRVKHDLPPSRDAACPQKWSEPMLKLAPFGSVTLLVPLLLGIRAGGSRAAFVKAAAGLPQFKVECLPTLDLRL
jgi:hypothetical protein